MRKNKGIAIGVLLVASGIGVAWADHGRVYTLTENDVPDGQGGNWYTSWFGINNRGTLVGNYGFIDGIRVEAAIFRDGRYQTFGVPGSYWTELLGINDHDVAVGDFADINRPDGSLFHPFLFEHGQVTRLPDLAIDNLNATAPHAINNRGVIVGQGYSDNYQTSVGWIYRQGHYTTVRHGLGPSTSLFGINDQGDVVGSYHPDQNGHFRGFRFNIDDDPPVYTDVQLPGVPGVVSWSARGINDRGDIMGVYYDVNNAPHGYVVDSSFQHVTLVDGGNDGHQWYGFNDNGDLAGTDSTFSYGFVATR